MQVVVAGASGLIGSALTASLRADGHHVKTLVRHPVSEPDVDSWEPARGLLDPDFLRGADAVVCLNGVGVADRRWTDAYKQAIVASRVDPVATVARTLADLAENGGRPSVFIAASAIGYYGDAGDREVTESDPAGDSFLCEVCVQWEAAAEPARLAGVRVTHLRTGLVLAKGAGLLKPLVPIIKAGLGGRLGSGQQFMPWISLADEIAAIRFLLEHDIAGPVNLVGPAPVRNAEFVKTLGHVLHRPSVLAVPGFAMRLAAGEVASEALGGQRAVPNRLLAAGFEFTHRDLESTLREVLSS